MTKEFLGEVLGTFIIVFVGCGTVALEVLFGAFGHIIPIALMWGFGVALAIFSSWKICPAHLNPAVTLAMVLNKDLPFKKLPAYWLAQVLGAFLGASVLFLLVSPYIESFESIKTISTAKMFGEYYTTSTLTAFLLEMIGTLFLVFMIFIIVSKIKQKNLIPILIGLVVSTAIIFIAPYTQCGINPARDLAPRVFSYFSGWETVAYSQSYFLVYVIAPLLGGVLAFGLFSISRKK